jgi:hypothetical protein
LPDREIQRLWVRGQYFPHPLPAQYHLNDHHHHQQQQQQHHHQQQQQQQHHHQQHQQQQQQHQQQQTRNLRMTSMNLNLNLNLKAGSDQARSTDLRLSLHSITAGGGSGGAMIGSDHQGAANHGSSNPNVDDHEAPSITGGIDTSRSLPLFTMAEEELHVEAAPAAAAAAAEEEEIGHGDDHHQQARIYY